MARPFTGSGAVLEALEFAGVPAVLFLGAPSAEMLARFGHVRAVGIAAGEPVLTNAFTLAPVPGAIASVGGQPVFVEVTEDLTLDFDDLAAKAEGARFLYVLPNFQNPTGRVIPTARRAALVAAAQRAGLPLVEDNPYGDLWFDTPPPPALSSHVPENSVYLGSFSKILAPGLRLGYIVAPTAVMPKLLQAKQAADLHTPSFNQRVVAEVLKDGFIERHVPTIRALYKQQCEAMLAALDREMAGLGLSWNRPVGGMFLWVQLPKGMKAVPLLEKAVEKGVAFVPGFAFYAGDANESTLRLSFVTATVDQINTGMAALAAAIRESL